MPVAAPFVSAAKDTLKGSRKVTQTVLFPFALLAILPLSRAEPRTASGLLN